MRNIDFFRSWGKAPQMNGLGFIWLNRTPSERWNFYHPTLTPVVVDEYHNHRNTFRVGDGTIKVTYEDYDLFDENFGHIFYTNKKFKNYHLKLDYRFYGEHVNSFTNENDAWNYKNSGVMLHSEHPNQMFLDQGFPVSIEGQFLGGSGVNDRPTLNMCSVSYTHLRAHET